MKEHPRLVSLVPSWTETLYSFGFGAEVVGVTRYCVHPKELVATVEKVGGTKDPDVARIIQLAPDLVVCDHEEQRKEDVDAMRAAGLDVFVSDVRSVDDSIRDVLRLGKRVDRAEAAETLCDRIADAMQDVVTSRTGKPIPVFVPIWRRPWMTLSSDTYAHHVLALAGAANVFADEGARYPTVEPKDALARGATAALLPSEPYPFHTKDVAMDELAAAGFARKRIQLLDGEALTWYGAREPDGLRAVAKTIQTLAS